MRSANPERQSTFLYCGYYFSFCAVARQASLHQVTGNREKQLLALFNDELKYEKSSNDRGAEDGIDFRQPQ